MRKDSRRKKNKEEEQKLNLKEKMTEVLELPKEVVLDIPKLVMLGNSNMIIENYKGIIEYDTNRIRVNTGMGIIKIQGNNLIIKEITSEDIMIDGKVITLEFLE
ncbi:MAG: sporulation protein YqfC [Clostridia bacterium]|nr:sporulation protein YqfC [Clostridia bacterium]